MKPEKIHRAGEERLAIKIFGGDEEAFRRKVKEALRASKQGGYRVGSGGFIRGIVGGNLNGDEFDRCKNEIMAEVRKLKAERVERKNQAKTAWLAGEAARAAGEEEARTEVDPEDYNRQ